MCGFGGILWKSGRTPDNASALLDCMERRLEHRGPDETGRRIGPGFAVIHRRLSIVDIADGHQPMLSDDERVGIAYNGEIYNHTALRTDPRLAGRAFRTRCDTETFLELFIANGTDCFARLSGMFAAFIWDLRTTPKFHLVRDQMGVKPLYVYEDERIIAFASELRAILALPGLDLSPDPEGYQAYLAYRYTAGPRTVFRRIQRVEAGSALTVTASGILRWRYWDLPKPDRHLLISEEEAAERLHELLAASVSAQMMGEVPIGLTLSGGIDSSVIACLCDALGAHFKSFNIGFAELNEFAYSQDVAARFGQQHFTIETSVKEIARNFDTVVWAMDEPIADPACFPLYILCAEIQKHVTVVLSGEGSDELLAGYPQYLHVMNGEPVPQPQQFQRFLEQSWYFPRSNELVLGRPDATRAHVHSSYFMERDLLDGMLQFDLKTWLPENLMMKADKILMSHSLEGRFPFLDLNVVNFVARLPPALKLRNGVGKLVLRRAFGSKLPRSVVERPKMGFSVPVDQLVQDFKGDIYDTISSSHAAASAEVLDLDTVRQLANRYFGEGRGSALQLWTIFILLRWHSFLHSQRPSFHAEQHPFSQVPAPQPAA